MSDIEHEHCERHERSQLEPVRAEAPDPRASWQRDPMLPDLSGQRVLITGATGGIGSGIATRFARAGAAVAVHYRSDSSHAEHLAEQLREHGGTAVCVQGDLSRPGEAAELITSAREQLGGLNGLVNNAGVQPLSLLAETSREDWDAVHSTNLSAVFELTREAARSFEQSAEIACWVTHIASIEASRPAVAHGHYAAAKAGLVMHARAAALEYGPQRIRINTVSPGLIDRPGLAENWPDGVQSWQQHAPLGRLGTSVDVGNACVFLASPLASFITGHDLVVDGGMLATPGW